MSKKVSVDKCLGFDCWVCNMEREKFAKAIKATVIIHNDMPVNAFQLYSGGEPPPAPGAMSVRRAIMEQQIRQSRNRWRT